MVQPPYGGFAAPQDAPPRSGRGCAVAVLVSAVLVLLLLGGGGIGFLLWLRGPGGEYSAAPECALVEDSGVLDGLVKGYQVDLDAPIDTGGADWWDGNQCRWTTTQESAGLPSSVSVAFVRSGNRPGFSGETSAQADLGREPEGNSVRTVEDLGDEAVQWYDTTTLHGCVAVRLSNLMVSTCYEASTDFAASREVAENEAVEGALTVAREIVASLEQD
ncbi:hypothetical protein NI17_013305 [Thermobifida halotolerans]|uniref:Uncharacterized protein n=1 Tax=Thermobifida halotolerans TaxID=483545 RepID=A0A399FZ21_9ACTN|nr:hypothetical protein [Thermobifida halotolerans]UOE17860.1 hypothetical protein NI17_013305 [Thermobifida halotolerans]